MTFFSPTRNSTRNQWSSDRNRRSPQLSIFNRIFSGDHKQKFYWGHKEILIPVYKHMSDAIEKHKEADVVINFASLRSAEEATLDILKYPQE